jgi:hypothetical protein
MTPELPGEYRRPTTPGYTVFLGVRGLGVSAATGLDVGILRNAGANAEFLVASTESALPVELRDIYPAVTGVLELKIGIRADNVVARLLADFDAESRRALRDT